MSNVLSKESGMSELNKCEAERKYLHKVYEEAKAENKQLKGFINSLMTEEQKDICNGEAMLAGEPTLQTPQDWIDRIRMFLEERDSLAEKVEDLEEEECRLELENKKLKEELEAEKFHSQQLKDCDYEGYCEYVGENKLIKEFEDLKNELGELKEDLEFHKLYVYTTDDPDFVAGLDKEDVDNYTNDESVRKFLYKKLKKV